MCPCISIWELKCCRHAARRDRLLWCAIKTQPVLAKLISSFCKWSLNLSQEFNDNLKLIPRLNTLMSYDLVIYRNCWHVHFEILICVFLFEDWDILRCCRHTTWTGQRRQLFETFQNWKLGKKDRLDSSTQPGLNIAEGKKANIEIN